MVDDVFLKGVVWRSYILSEVYGLVWNRDKISPALLHVGKRSFPQEIWRCHGFRYVPGKAC